MEHPYNHNQSFRPNYEESKMYQNNVPNWPGFDARPESTEIRVDPGGRTSTNFRNSNDSPFYLPEINMGGKSLFSQLQYKILAYFLKAFILFIMNIQKV